MNDLQLSSYDYVLPRDRIAQEPVEPRDAARLLVLERQIGATHHCLVRDLPSLLKAGDILVVNRTRVLPSRLIGTKEDTGGRVDLTLLRPKQDDESSSRFSARSASPSRPPSPTRGEGILASPLAGEAGPLRGPGEGADLQGTSARLLDGGATWEALLHGHRLRPGQRVRLEGGVTAEIAEPTPVGTRLVHFADGEDVNALLRQSGQIPLPPYIHDYQGAPERYQTVYADAEGAAAAPTAGLHFTPELIARLKDRGIGWTSIVLHIGLDTFRPITEDDVRQRHIHTEWVQVPAETVEAISQARAHGGRVFAVGTSTVRALEYAVLDDQLQPCEGPADLFIVPGYQFRTVDALLTNFHMPRTTVLLLAAAFAGRDRLFSAYEEAIQQGYRFLSFGDAMLIL